MPENIQSRTEELIKEMIKIGKEEGFVTYDSIIYALEDDISYPGQVEEIVQKLKNEGVTLPELPTQKHSIDVIMGIEANLREIMRTTAYWPVSVRILTNEYSRVKEGVVELRDIIASWLDPEGSPPFITYYDHDSENIDGDSTQNRFDLLLKQLVKVEEVLEKQGSSSKQSEEEINALAEKIQYFKLPPALFSTMLNQIRDVFKDVRSKERAIMSLCVHTANMPRDTFDREFPGNETNEEWVSEVSLKNQDYSEALRAVMPDILREQRSLKQIERDSGLGLAMIKETNHRISIRVARIHRAKRKLVEACTPILNLVATPFVKDSANLGLQLSDLTRAGKAGIERAVDQFNYRFCGNFSTWAVWFTRNGIIQLNLKHMSISHPEDADFEGYY